jgi:hypothetical protein
LQVSLVGMLVTIVGLRVGTGVGDVVADASTLTLKLIVAALGVMSKIAIPLLARCESLYASVLGKLGPTDALVVEGPRKLTPAP